MVRGIARGSGAFEAKAVGLLVGIIFVSGVVSVRPCMAQEPGALEERLAALRAAGHPTCFAELRQLEQIPAGARNAAALYEAAGKAFVQPTEANRANVPMLGKGEFPDLGESLPESMVEAIGTYLKRNDECLSLLHEAAQIEHCQFSRDDHGEPHAAESRACAHLLALAAVYRANQGDMDAAIARIADALRLCQVIPNEKMFLGHIKRCASIGLILHRIEQVLNIKRLTHEQLKALDRMCGQTTASLDVTEALDVERCFAIEHWTNPKLLAEEYGLGLIVIAPIAEKALVFSLDRMADYMVAVDLPLPQRLPAIEKIDKELETLEPQDDESEPNSQDPRVPKMLGALTLPLVHQGVELDLDCRADLRSVRTTLAVQRYRLAEGKLPETLDQLVPKYFDRVPIDPFDGQPLRYRRTDPGFVVYSVWWDGRDNGGVPKGDVRRGEPFDSPFLVRR